MPGRDICGYPLCILFRWQDIVLLVLLLFKISVNFVQPKNIKKNWLILQLPFNSYHLYIIEYHFFLCRVAKTQKTTRTNYFARFFVCSFFNHINTIYQCFGMMRGKNRRVVWQIHFRYHFITLLLKIRIKCRANWVSN